MLIILLVVSRYPEDTRMISLDVYFLCRLITVTGPILMVFATRREIYLITDNAQPRCTVPNVFQFVGKINSLIFIKYVENFLPFLCNCYWCFAANYGLGHWRATDNAIYERSTSCNITWQCWVIWLVVKNVTLWSTSLQWGQQFFLCMQMNVYISYITWQWQTSQAAADQAINVQFHFNSW